MMLFYDLVAFGGSRQFITLDDDVEDYFITPVYAIHSFSNVYTDPK